MQLWIMLNRDYPEGHTPTIITALQHSKGASTPGDIKTQTPWQIPAEVALGDTLRGSEKDKGSDPPAFPCSTRPRATKPCEIHRNEGVSPSGAVPREQG